MWPLISMAKLVYYLLMRAHMNTAPGLNAEVAILAKTMVLIGFTIFFCATLPF